MLGGHRHSRYNNPDCPNLKLTAGPARDIFLGKITMEWRAASRSDHVGHAPMAPRTTYAFTTP